MKYPKVNIILLNYNGWEDTIECLESLQKITYPNYNLIVVDNNSTDKSIEKIKKWCNGELKVNSNLVSFDSENKPIKVFEYSKKNAEQGGNNKQEKIINNLPSKKKMILIKSNKNIGFAGGNNIAIKYSLQTKVDYIMLLNNDTVVKNNFLEPLINTARNNEKVGIVGGKIYYYDEPQKIAFGGGNLNLIKGIGEHYYDNRFKEIKEVTFLTGCLWLIKPGVFKKTGLIDEKYFLYLEDLDFCFQLQKLGYKLFYNPNSIIYHKESRTTGRLSPISIYYASRNRPYFIHKNSNSIFYIIMFWLFFIPTRIILLISYGKKGINILSGLFDFYKNNFHKK